MSTAPDTGNPAELYLSELDETPESAVLAFLPLHKRALGVAFGTAAAALVFCATAFSLVFIGGDPSGLRLLGEYFYGYEVSWTGAVIGAFWGFVTAFVFAWFAAFVRNLVIATFVFVARTRHELRQTRDFLDHI